MYYRLPSPHPDWQLRCSSDTKSSHFTLCKLSIYRKPNKGKCWNGRSVVKHFNIFLLIHGNKIKMIQKIAILCFSQLNRCKNWIAYGKKTCFTKFVR